jgi:uncharacterized protein YbjT (DUF2867 family)
MIARGEGTTAAIGAGGRCPEGACMTSSHVDRSAPSPRRRALLAGLAAVAAALGCGPALQAAAAADAAAATPGTAAPPAPRSVLVFGGTGQLGAQVVRRFVAAGDRVTVFARPGADRARLQGLAVGYVTGDLLDAAEVAAALRATRPAIVVNAVRVEDGDVHFYEKIMRPMVAYSKETGVRQLIHHGAVGAGDNAAKFPTLGWDKVPGLLERLADQGVGERLLRDSGVPYTIIRNARIYPDETPATGRAELTEDDTVISPMTRADLAELTLRCARDPLCLGKTYHVRDASLAWPPPGAAPR